jgi:DNA sulfur modification protein DndC
MSAMIQNDAEKEWMMPLLEIRNALDFRQMGGEDEDSSDRKLRDYRRMNGSVQLYYDRVIPGPYLQEVRENWLRKVLTAQTWIRKNGPSDVKAITLLTMDELHEIRRIWVVDKHEIEDRLPAIYEESTGEPFPKQKMDDAQTYGVRELRLLKEVCGEDRNQYELTRSLLSIASQHKTGQRRAKLHSEFTSQFRRHSYASAEEALQDKLAEEAKRKEAEGGAAE